MREARKEMQIIMRLKIRLKDFLCVLGGFARDAF
jgi:hypothetical protein